MLENIKAKGKVRDIKRLNSNNDHSASARLDEDGTGGGKDARIFTRNASSHQLWEDIPIGDLPGKLESGSGSQRDGN